MSDSAANERRATANRPWWRTRRYLVRTAIFIALYLALLVYPVARVIDLIAPRPPFDTLLLLAVLVLPILGRVLYERHPNAFTRSCAAVSLTWLGLAFQLFPLVLGFEILNLAMDLHDRTAGWTLVALISAVGLGGFVNAQHLSVRDVSIEGGDSVRGMSVVQVSDVHIGSRSPRLLKRIVDKVNALGADFVLITGDLIDFAGISREELGDLARVQAPCFFVIGNHERYVDLHAICERLRALGIRVLRNEATIAGPFQFIGVDDADKPAIVESVLERLPISGTHYPILLYHRPDGFEPAARRNIPLTLAGHTHAGQIIPFNFIVKRVYPRMRGLHRLGSSSMYVSPGTGTWGPVLRVGSRSEITRHVFV